MDGDNILEIILEARGWNGNGNGMTTGISLPLFLTIRIRTMVIQVSRVCYRHVISSQ